MNRSVEDRTYAVGLVVIGLLAMVASFRHVADAAIRFGQSSPGWLPYALAGTPDLLAVIAGISIRRRHRVEASVRGPIALLVMAVVVLVAAQLVTAQPSFGGWFAAAWPAIAFLSVVALVETEPGRRPPQRRPTPRPASSPAPAATAAPADPVPIPPAPSPASTGLIDESAPAPRPRAVVDVDDLLLVGQAVAADLAHQGQSLTRRSLLEGLRARGVAIGTTKASELLERLRAA